MDNETIYAEGVYFDKPREGAPEFVKGRLSFNVEKAIPFLQKYKNEKGYVNCDLLKSKESGKLYLKLNTYGLEKKEEELTPEDVPF
jgi:hypothetical protein